MSNYISERENILKLFNEEFYMTDFKAFALLVFNFQYKFNPIYNRYCELINIQPADVSEIHQIPFLPISMFKNYTIKTGDWTEEKIFGSSGTTGYNRSKHYINDENLYLKNARKGFEEFYGSVEAYCFIAILPGYSDRQDSSLISMVNDFIKKSKHKFSGYYLNKEKEMLDVLDHCQVKNIPTILFGVSFALLDLCKLDISFPDLKVIETGGMKTSKIELTKEEIIGQFKKSWNLKQVGSEYGMTELLSQSYSTDGKWYKTASTKKVIIGELRDPFQIEKNNRAGIIKVIDCANFDTCSFIETEDLGMKDLNQGFQVLGRMDNAELRGCNLLLDQSLENPVS